MLYVDEDEYERVSRKMRDMMARDGLGMMETRFRHKSGRSLDIYLSVSHLDPQNASTGTVAAILDITARKRPKSMMEYSPGHPQYQRMSRINADFHPP
jgi:PAS domain S-box-containing protein